MSEPVAGVGVSLWLACCLATAGCGHGGAGQPRTFGEGPFEQHQDAVATFQRLSGAVRPLGQPAPCLELCQQQTRVCATADEVCDAQDARCKESRSGCAWTRSLLPNECRYCSTES